ncbi:MAG: hypothetical protein IJ932_05460 [Ruminococcus sp.]|nr:hypothetical protein [Ruminococcus sp.]
MLVALNIENQLPKTRLEKLINTVRGDKIISEIKNIGGVALRDITYINRRGKINLDKLASALGETKCIICNGDAALPEGFFRFENREFRSLLSINLGVYILEELKKAGENLPVGFCDPDGLYSEHIIRLSRCCNNLTAVTDNLEQYDEISEKILYDSGAVVSVTDNRRRLADCRLIIAPKRVREPICTLGNTVILSGEKPSVSLSGVCYYEYSIRTPNSFAVFKPPRFTAEYFSGALYSLARRYELGSVVPTSCSDRVLSQTPASLVKYLKNS